MTLSFDINAVDETLRHQFVARAELISTISKQRRFDFIVIGGGIHGAAFARLAALNNLSVLLLERGDYASQTSSRSSKLAHGGLRYLEMFDFIQVFEGIQAREELFEVAHHLVKPQQFVIPIPQHDWYLQSKIWLGLLLYDLMTGKWSNIKRHRFHSIKDLAFQFLRENRLSLSGCFSYMDGILNDSRLVIDNILSTRQEGGQALNYAEVMRVLQLKSSASSLVHWQDKLTGKQYEAEAGLVINCAGPWVSKIEGVRPSAAEDRICYSQGAHLLFNKPWRDPALFLPIDNKGRYYFVLPHFAGTLVGTTEREINKLEEDPQPTAAEVDEILERLARDLPGSGLNRNSLHYSFAGVRTLPLRRAASGTAGISRRHIWSYNNGVLTLLGGKYTTYSWTAYEGLKLAFKLSELTGSPDSAKGRLLPGAGAYEASQQEYKKWCKSNNLPDSVALQTFARLGSRVRFIPSLNQPIVVIGESLLQAEVDLAVLLEQAETLEDLMRRRLELEFLPGNGLDLMSAIGRRLKEHRPTLDLENQEMLYRNRLSDLKSIMRI